MLMPPLIAKWNLLKDEDKDLFPLLEVCQPIPCSAVFASRALLCDDIFNSLTETHS